MYIMKDQAESLLSYVSPECYHNWNFLELLAEICYEMQIDPYDVLHDDIVDHVHGLVCLKLKEDYELSG